MVHFNNKIPFYVILYSSSMIFFFKEISLSRASASFNFYFCYFCIQGIITYLKTKKFTLFDYFLNILKYFLKKKKKLNLSFLILRLFNYQVLMLISNVLPDHSRTKTDIVPVVPLKNIGGRFFKGGPNDRNLKMVNQEF